MAYTTQANVEAVLKRSLTAQESVLLPLLLSSIDSWINEQIGGEFGAGTTTTKYYDGGTAILDIDPCNTITKIALYDEAEVEIDEYVLNEDYEARPRNDTLKRWIHSRVGEFPCGVANIGVTATFTMGTTVPDEIEYLASYMIAQMLLSNESGNLKQESIEGYSRTFGQIEENNAIVSILLDKYRNTDILI